MMICECKLCGKNISDGNHLIPWYNDKGGEELVCLVCGRIHYLCNRCYNNNYRDPSIHNCISCNRDSKIKELLEEGGNNVSM